MRLIGNIETEKQAFTFYSLLLREGIHSSYEPQYDTEEGKTVVRIWIYEEDAIDRAKELFEEFKQDPDAPQFAEVEFPEVPPQPPDTIAEARARGKEEEEVTPPWKNHQAEQKKRPSRSYPLTLLIILLCVALYLFNSVQQYSLIKSDGGLGVRLGFTPLQRDLMFEYPKDNQEIDAVIKKYSLKSVKDLKALPPNEAEELKRAQSIPSWKGILPYLLMGRDKKGEATKDVDVPLFIQIRKGELWRLFTPCLLHGGLLHILFNMAWAFLLVRQVEDRLSKFKVILLIVLIGIVSNVAQYFVSGPLFLGFSGVVCGLVGFIWVRQKFAPWEGYPLQRSTILFVLIFVLGLFLLEIFSLVTAAITAKKISAGIANTAHIIGGITGALLGKSGLFKRRLK